MESKRLVLLTWAITAFTVVSGQDIVKNVTLIASDTLFSSPGYVNSLNYTINTTRDYRFHTNYPNHTLLLTVLEFVLEAPDKNSDCLYDKVTLYNGYNDSAPIMKTLCGNINAGTTYSTTGNTVYVVLYSDGTKTYKGFQMSVKSQFISHQLQHNYPGKSNHNDDEDNNFPLWIIVGCCVGVILLILLILLLVCLLKREKRSVEPENEHSENEKRTPGSNTQVTKSNVPSGEIVETNIFDLELPTAVKKANLLPPLSSNFSPPTPAPQEFNPFGGKVEPNE